MPVSNSSKRMPNWAMPSSNAFCSGEDGKIACCASGHTQPKGAKQQAAEEFAHDGRLTDALHHLPKPAAYGNQEGDLDK